MANDVLLEERASTIHGSFEAGAAKWSDKVAVRCGDEAWTYGELDVAAGQIAHLLAEKGVASGELVAIRMGRSPMLVAAMLGTLKCGAAFVPIDPDMPAQRAGEILADSFARILLVGSAENSLASIDVETLVLDAAAFRARVDPVPAIQAQASSTSDAYVIFTSGSTGVPKGVVVTHGNVLRLFAVTQPLFGFADQDIWSVLHSPGFDFSVWEIWGALLHGGTAELFPGIAASDLTGLSSMVADRNISMLSFTPGAFSLFARASIERGVAFPCLRHVVLGGEKVELSHVEKWCQAYPDVALVNMYGITETTVHTTFKRVDPAAVARGEPVSIGVPLSDLEIHLLDEEGRLVSEGEIGEIAIAGAGVARGYLNRPDLTTERFPSRQLGGAAPVRLYLSGDLARWSGGELHYAGRRDSQVKIRGYRIELGEVSARIGKLAGVADCVTVKQSLGNEDSRLVAFVRPGPSWPGERIILDQAAKSLPSYMRPAFLVSVDEFPLTRNGKVDAAALLAHIDTAFSATMPADSAEEEVMVVASLAREILRTDDLAHDIELIDQGATSLSLVRLILAVNARLSVQLTGLELDGDSSILAIARAARTARESTLARELDAV